MGESFSAWDAVDYINTLEDASLYLEAAIDEDTGDGTLIRAALGDIARAQNMSKLARNTGLDRSNLYKAMAADGNPSFTTILKVIQALGLRLQVRTAQASEWLLPPETWPIQIEEPSNYEYALQCVPAEV